MLNTQTHTAENTPGILAIDFGQLRDEINETFAHSDEATYWRKRLANKHKHVDSYRRRSTSRNRRLKKRMCVNTQAFKRPKKWWGYDDKYFDQEALDYFNLGLEKKRPCNNLVHCHNCRKSKYLFGSKKEADLFIEYHHDAIMRQSGYAPVRSYFCSFCGGWHVTHLAEENWNPGKTWAEITLEKINKSNEQLAISKAQRKRLAKAAQAR